MNPKEVEKAKVDLEGLIQLQRLDLKVVELQKLGQDLPRRLQELDSRLENERHQLGRAEDRLEDSDKDRRRLEGEVEDFRAKRTRYKEQLMEVKTNEAYQAMLHEIEYVERQILTKEDEILERMLRADELEQLATGERSRFEQAEKEVLSQKSKLEKEARQAAEELGSLQGQRAQLEAGLDPALLAQYARIAAARNGVALAPLDGHSCQACRVRVRPQLIAEVRTNRHIIPCENCSRILYDLNS